MSDYNNIDELLLEADELNISPEIIRLALFDLDSLALQNLIHACLEYPDPYLYDHFVFHICQKALELRNENSLDAMKMILAHDNGEEAHSLVIWTLGQLEPVESILPILREALEDSYAGTYRPAAAVIFKLVYQEDSFRAINDENAKVRLFAAQEAEKNYIITTILKMLAHKDWALRRIAAWYCGRNKVQSAFELLIQEISQENAIEALRAMIWALGVLGNPQAQIALEPFLKHHETLIIQTAREALQKLG